MISKKVATVISASIFFGLMAHTRADDQGYLLDPSRWQSNRVAVCWENGGAATATEQGWVRKRVTQTWDAASAVSFTGWGNCTTGTTSGIRILIQDAGPRTLGLGRNLNNVTNGMLLNFTFSNWGSSCASSSAMRRSCIESNAIHEFGHALGIAHEQNRPDTDRSLCTDAPQGTNGDVIIGPFDNESIMNYCFNSSYNNALSPTDRATIETMYSKKLVDFNGDGRTDVALTRGYGWGSIPVAFSYGTGAFLVTNQAVTSFPSWAQTANVRVVHGDFNNDGLTDVALTGGAGWGSIPVAFSNGDGNFTVTNSGVASFPTWATTPSAQHFTGDFNGDGYTDIALIGVPGWASIPVALSNGNGAFTVVNGGVGAFATWASTGGVKIVAEDFNGDGLTDFALTGVPGWSSIPVAFANGNGTFSITNYAVPNFPQWASTINVTIHAGDFNADGRADLALSGGPGWTTIPVAFSNGNGTFSVTNKSVGPSFNSWSFTLGARLVAADFNGDGRTDIAITGPTGWGSIPMAIAQGNGSWVTTNQAVASFPVWASTSTADLVLGDFNRNRYMDLGLTGVYGWGSLPVAFSQGGGMFSVTNYAIANFASWASYPEVLVVKQNQ